LSSRPRCRRASAILQGAASFPGGDHADQRRLDVLTPDAHGEVAGTVRRPIGPDVACRLGSLDLSKTVTAVMAGALPHFLVVQQAREK
jgi:hypothetical protein